MTHPLGDDFQERMRSRRKADSESSFEKRLVEFTLQRFKLGHVKRQMTSEAMEMTGKPLLTFAMFNDRFPGFPVELRASRLDGVKLHADTSCSFPKWFTAFGKLPPVRSWAKLREQYSTDELKTFGLVFPRNLIQRGLVIHNGDPDQYGSGSFLVHRSEEEQTGLVVQTYSSFLDAIDRGDKGWIS